MALAAPGQADRRRARRLLDQLGIGDLAQRHIRDLSGGQQQRVFLARVLIAKPELLVLDESTNGVDMNSAENIFHQLADLNQVGMTILLTTHDLNMAAAHVPWVVCLNRRVIAQGTPEQVFTEPILSETYPGEMMVIRQSGLIFIQIAAALVIPAITARLLTDSFHRMIILSTGLGALSGFLGMYLSFYVDVSSGATIVLLQAALFSMALIVMARRKNGRLPHTHL